ncbi:hypothetical protein [Azospirillum halopraeferens]|uniref:hypothetical protein n=1 Tax=Azospirillum halopraeferens TaxID=34010 RepID=UPI00041452CE|nr:hypothetical protein [Azospirillum halopraeferens]
MLFEFEPSGINDTYLRLTRNAISCILVPAGTWNGLLRMNYLVSGPTGGSEPHFVFRAADVGWDDGRFFWRGKAAPVVTSTAMVNVLLERGMAVDSEVEMLVFATAGDGGAARSDERLMLRALLGGCTFTPIYEDRPDPFGTGAPPAVTGFAVRTLADPGAFVVEARDGLPVLDPDTRRALQRQVG